MPVKMRASHRVRLEGAVDTPDLFEGDEGSTVKLVMIGSGWICVCRPVLGRKIIGRVVCDAAPGISGIPLTYVNDLVGDSYAEIERVCI